MKIKKLLPEYWKKELKKSKKTMEEYNEEFRKTLKKQLEDFEPSWKGYNFVILQHPLRDFFGYSINVYKNKDLKKIKKLKPVFKRLKMVLKE